MGSFSIALSGLSAQAEALNIVSNNLANLNTTGFKGSDASFQDLVTEAMNGTTPNGAGVSSVTAQKNFNQGSVQVTSGAFDAAIQGNGFFVVQNSQGQQLYTRAGNFTVDTNGNLVTQSGDFVMGFTATDGVVNPSGAPGKITIPAGLMVQPSPSTAFSLDANLNAAGLTSDSTGTFSAPITVVDSLGATHTLTATFTKTAANAWNYEITAPGADTSGGKAGTPTSLAKGSLTFNGSGQLITPAPGSGGSIDVKMTGLADGASDLDLKWNLYNSDNTSTLTQYSQTSATSATTVDGVAAAQLTNVTLGDGGTVVANFSNGTTQTVGQLAMASISNPESMVAVGNNELTAGAQTSTPSIGIAGTGSRGQIKGGALEASNVDIATEFTNLMTFQRSYEANSRTITTLDQMAQDLMQMKP